MIARGSIIAYTCVLTVQSQDAKRSSLRLSERLRAGMGAGGVIGGGALELPACAPTLRRCPCRVGLCRRSGRGHRGKQRCPRWHSQV